MIPGPTLVRECEHCQGLFLESTLLSGNNFGARQWTDGVSRALMDSNTPLGLGVCPHCDHVFKLGKQQVKAEFGGYPNDWDISISTDQYSHTPDDDTPSEMDPKLQISGEANTKFANLPGFKRLGFEAWLGIKTVELRYLSTDETTCRLLAWRAGNDAWRSGESPARMRKRKAKTIRAVRSSDEIDNMRWLIKHLGNEPDERLTKSELFRQLEDFRWAHKMLEAHLPDACLGFRSYLNGLVDARDPSIHLLPSYVRLPRPTRLNIQDPDDVEPDDRIPPDEEIDAL